MEGDEQRRQYDQQNFSRGFVPDLRSNSTGGNASERLRQSQMLASRTPVSTPGQTSQDLGGFAYHQGQQYTPPQMQGSSIQYAADYGQDPQRQQHFPQYTSQMMYNVSQQPQPQSPYDPVPQYQPRQTAALEVLSTQFGVPQYYHSGEPTSTPGQVGTPQQYPSTTFQQPLTYQTPGSVGRSTLSTSFPTGMADYPQGPPPDAVEQSEEDDSSYDKAYNDYQTALRKTFENTSKGMLEKAGESLLEISEWLLGHASELGLVSDNPSLHDERLKLWNEFNTCWLAVLQRQKDETQKKLDSGRFPTPPKSVLKEPFLHQMAEALVQLCDGMEKYGLVDYQMGVWEEEIMSILTQCLDLLEGDESDPSGAEASSLFETQQRSGH